MIQDIEPMQFNNVYEPEMLPSDEDYALIYENGEMVFKNKDYDCFTIGDTKHLFGDISYQYLFSIDDMHFFLAEGADVSEYKTRRKIIQLRDTNPQWISFAGACGAQLMNWYHRNRCCGACGAEMQHSTSERAVVCPKCNNTVYPTIAPAVIVALVSGERILLTKYAHGPYKRYALVAGYNEIGETIEETVSREVMEEVGLKVKRLRYFGSQPWPFSGTQLMGFVAELDGSGDITLDRNELSTAEWKRRDEIIPEENPRSLTNTMIQAFRENRL